VRSHFGVAARSALFHLQFTLNGKHLMAGCLAVAPKAQVNSRLPHTELVKRDLGQPMMPLSCGHTEPF
jgi:hypothetical protein